MAEGHLADVAASRPREANSNLFTLLHSAREDVLAQNLLLQQQPLILDAVSLQPQPLYTIGQAATTLGVLPAQQDFLLRELLARAACKSRDDIGLSYVAEAALKTEIEMLDHAHHSILVQQQRLTKLINQSQSEPATRYLVQLAKAYQQLTHG